MNSASVLGTDGLSPVATVMRPQREEYWQELRDDYLGFVGSSKEMVLLRTTLRHVGVSERPVLVCGPPGSGKQLVVEALHRLRTGNRATSARGSSSPPIVVVGCAGMSDVELEFLLFGNDRAKGMLGAAEDGTLVLEDIGALSARLQTKIARVLETGMYRPIGALMERKFQARLLAVSCGPLERAVREGSFRSDLLYRLSSAVITVPSLEEHKEDIPALVYHFLRQEGSVLRLTADALDLLVMQSWRGNVRELRNLVERCAVSWKGRTADAAAITSLLASEPAGNLMVASLTSIATQILGCAKGNKLAAMESALLSQAMALSGGNKSAAARLLGIHRKAVERKLDKHGRLDDLAPSSAPAPHDGQELGHRAMPAGNHPTLAS